jgi:hypothetical protein
MAQTLLVDVEFQLVKAASAPAIGSGGAAWQVRLPPRRTLVVPTALTQQAVATVLASDITVPNGYSIEILGFRSAVQPGTEGGIALS